jgi:nicotinamide-nucleotide amidase
MEHSVLPYLRQRLGVREVIISRVLKLFGIGESVVDEKIKDLIEKGVNPTIGLLAHTQIGEIHIRLTAKAVDEDSAVALNRPLEDEIRRRLGHFIFGADGETYEGVLGLLIRKAGLSLSVAETSFGSSIIQTLKGIAGSEEFFRLGLTLVSPDTAPRLLNLPRSFSAGGGLFGMEAAKALAEAVRSLAATDLGLGLTGRAGKERGQDHLIHIALAHGRGTDFLEQRWPFAMQFIENRMTKMALAQVRKYLLKA